jgi:hypothetical protein
MTESGWVETIVWHNTNVEKETMVNHSRLAQIAGVIGLTGGVIQILYGVLAIPFPYAQASYGWDEVLWAFAIAGMIGGTVGLVALDVARPRWLALLGATLSIAGNLLRILASVQIILLPDQDPTLFILLSIALMVVGLSIFGITVLIAKQLTGWQAWLPLLAGASMPLLVAIYYLDTYIHFILLGAWGIPWLLIAYLIYTRAAMPRSAIATAHSN